MRTRWRGVMAGVLVLAPCLLVAQEPVAIGVVRGTVKSTTGAAIAGADVSVAGTVRRSTTREDGSYVVVGVPAGTVQLLVRRVGYTPVRREVLVRAGETTVVDVELRSAVTELAPVVVRERREPFDARLAGFRSRLESKPAGFIFSRADIERSANRNTLDLLRTVPGVRIQPAPRGSGQAQTVRFRTNRCPPAVFIDGFAASAGEFDLSTIDLQMVEGVEVYLSSTTLPAEFFAISRSQEQCGVVAIWSRPTQARVPRVRTSGDLAREAQEVRDGAFAADAVDETAFIHGGDPTIVYPDSLWRDRTAGSVKVEFVVDARGRLRWDTFRVLEESNAGFTRAVMESLVTARWEPARKDGRSVSQVVVFPVEFLP